MKYYTIEELSELWGFKPNFIRNLIKKRELGAVKFGVEYRITQEQIDQYIADNSITVQKTITAEDDPNNHE